MRIQIVLPLIFVLSTAMTGASQFSTPSSAPFELQGDRLGESLVVFTSQHPKAQCEDSTKTRKNCYQWDDVSIFGFTADPKPECTPAKHSALGCVQGLSAQFADGHLIMLSYAVVGKDKQPAVPSLKEKYGTPTMDTRDATIWSAGGSVLSVVVGKASEQDNAETIITFMMQG